MPEKAGQPDKTLRAGAGTAVERDPVRVVFVGGLDRAGTTLLERILGELPGVRPLGEIVHLWRHNLRDGERCSCGARFGRCGFWRAVGARAFGGWRHVDTGRVLMLREAVERTRHIPRLAAGRLPAHYQAIVSEYAGYYARIYQAAAQVSGATVVTDSSRSSALAYCLRWSPGIDLRVVHMVRDTRDPRLDALALAPRSAVMPLVRDPARSALAAGTHGTAFALLRRCGVPVHRVAAERLVADPAATVRGIADFAGVPAGELDFLAGGAVRLGPYHSAAGDPVRFVTGTLPLRWSDGRPYPLAPAQRRLAPALALPLGAYGHGRR